MKCVWLCDLPVLRFLCIGFETDPSKSSLKPLPCRSLWIFRESRSRWRPDGFVCWQSFVRVDSTLQASSGSWEDRADQALKDSRVARRQALTCFWLHTHVLTVCADNGVQFQEATANRHESFILFLFKEFSLLLFDKLGFHHALPLRKCRLLWKHQIRSWLFLLLLRPCESGTVTCIAYPELQEHCGFNSVQFPAPAPWPSTMLAHSRCSVDII